MKDKNKKNSLSKFQLILGILIALTGAVIMFHGNIFGENNSGIAIITGIVGISLIATSKKKR